MIEPPRAGLRMAWTNMWRHRRFVGYFGGVFLRKLYARTWLGWLWLPLRPALWVLARIIVFGGVLGVASVDAPYPLFFLVATAAWQLFAQCATWSTRSVELNRATLRVLQVPRSVVVSAAAVPSVLEFLIYTAFVLAAVVYYFIRADYLYISFGLRTLLVPAGLLLLMALGIGIGFVTSTFAASARDVRFGLQYVLAFGYFLTPVIYPLSTVPEKYRPLVELNPVTGAIEMVKDGLFASHELSSDAVLVTVAAAIVIWIPGLWLVHRRELKRLVRT